MNWIQLREKEQLQTLQAESLKQPVLIFKHSTRCSISRMVLDRLERSWNQDEVVGVKSYFLDLITYREISNQIASLFNVEHESPQMIVIHEGKAIYHTSHYDIDFAKVKDVVKEKATL
jgi:bacillithiol system protein YtxJ